MAFDPLLTPVDFILLNGQRSPGLATVEGAGLPRKWDELVGYGWSGSFTVYKGQRLATWKVHLDLVEPQDWIDWEAFRTLLARPISGQRPKALDIWHPWLAPFGIKSCVVRDVTQPTETDDAIWRVSIDFMEFRAPKRALARPDASTTKDGTPQSAAEAAFVAAAKEDADKLRELAK